MSEQLFFPWITLSLLILGLTAVWSWREPSAEKARRFATIGLFAVFIAVSLTSLEVLRNARRISGETFTLLEPVPAALQWFSANPLNGLLLPLFTGLTLGLVVLAPRRKVTPRWLSGLLILAGSTLATYAAQNLAIFALAWSLTLVPFLTKRFFSQTEAHALPPASRITLWVSAVLLPLGIALLTIASPGPTIAARLNLTQPRGGSEWLLYTAFALLIVAIVLRKGLFPAHSWVAPSFEQGPLIPLTLLFNGHLGAFALARLVLPLLPGTSMVMLPMLGNLGLFTAGYTTLFAIRERSPRKLLALLAISQSSFLVAGLESTNHDAITGALVHWQVVAVSTSVLTAVYAVIEARLGGPINGQVFLGLAKSAPRLAVFFASAGLALVGLPLTLGFVAEDLLLHGTLETHPFLGFILPIVTALNAFHIIRLFATLFLGRPGKGEPLIVDALPRERWVLTAAILFLVIGGILPAIFVELPANAAEHLLQTLRIMAPTLH